MKNVFLKWFLSKKNSTKSQTDDLSDEETDNEKLKTDLIQSFSKEVEKEAFALSAKLGCDELDVFKVMKFVEKCGIENIGIILNVLQDQNSEITRDGLYLKSTLLQMTLDEMKEKILNSSMNLEKKKEMVGLNQKDYDQESKNTKASSELSFFVFEIDELKKSIEKISDALRK